MYFFTPTHRKPEFYIQAPQSPRPNPIYFTANTFGYIKVKKQDQKSFPLCTFSRHCTKLYVYNVRRHLLT